MGIVEVAACDIASSLGFHELPPGQKVLAAQSGCWGELPTQALDLA